MELYLVRHGETIWNKEGRYYGWTDVDLSEVGKTQAAELGIFLKTISFDKVISSPLIRAIHTAKELVQAEIVTDERLKEQNFGIFEGKTYGELWEQYPQELDQWNQDYENYVIPSGESFQMVRKRVDAFVEELWKEEGRILLVAHKGTFGHMLASLMRMPLSGYWNFVFEQRAYTKIDIQDGYAILRAVNQIPVL